MSYPLHRRNRGTQAQIDNNLIVDAPLNGTLTNLLGNQYTIITEVGSVPEFVAEGGRQVYQNIYSGQTNSRALVIRENAIIPAFVNYAMEFDFNLNSLTNNQAIIGIDSNGTQSGIKFRNAGSGLFSFVIDISKSGSVVNSSGNMALSANMWYHARFEIFQNAGNVTINNQTLSYTVTGLPADFYFILGSQRQSWGANPIMGKIKDLKIWKL